MTPEPRSAADESSKQRDGEGSGQSLDRSLARTRAGTDKSRQLEQVADGRCDQHGRPSSCRPGGAGAVPDGRRATPPRPAAARAPALQRERTASTRARPRRRPGGDAPRATGTQSWCEQRQKRRRGNRVQTELRGSGNAPAATAPTRVKRSTERRSQSGRPEGDREAGSPSFSRPIAIAVDSSMTIWAATKCREPRTRSTPDRRKPVQGVAGPEQRRRRSCGDPVGGQGDEGVLAGTAEHQQGERAGLRNEKPAATDTAPKERAYSRWRPRCRGRLAGSAGAAVPEACRPRGETLWAKRRALRANYSATRRTPIHRACPAAIMVPRVSKLRLRG